MKFISSALIALLCYCGNIHADDFQFNVGHLRTDWEQIGASDEDEAYYQSFDLIENDDVSLEIERVNVVDPETTLEGYLQQLVDYFAGTTSCIPALSIDDDEEEDEDWEERHELLSIEKVWMGNTEWIQVVESGSVSFWGIALTYQACTYSTLLDGKIYIVTFTTDPELYEEYALLFDETARHILND